jgi:CDP-diacylglycerol--glycerol-3-phosphate 3-phosphatidyltransferase
MASVYDLKPRFQQMLRPTLRGLADLGVTPNQLTTAGVLLSAGAGAMIAWQPTARWPLVAFPAALLLRMALNALDGMMARELEMQSTTGAFLNELGDVVSDTALYLPLALVPGVSPGLVIAVVLLAALTEMAGVVAVQVGATRRYDGPMGKSDRALVLGSLGLILGLGVHPGAWTQLVLGATALLLILTITVRARRAQLAVEEVTS